MGQTLILTVGLPCSGKSTWALQQTRRYASPIYGSPIVCPDQIRLALHGQRFVAMAEPFVWAIARTMVISLFGAGHQKVILDACNTTRKRRDDWLESAASLEEEAGCSVSAGFDWGTRAGDAST